MSDTDNQDEKTKFPISTDRWSSDIENSIKNIGESCRAYKWMNFTASSKASKKRDYNMYISGFLASISGILSTINTSNCENTDAISIIVTVISFLIGAMLVIMKKSKHEEKSLSYKAIGAKYSSLEANIRRQLSLCRKDRVNPGQYFQWISISFEELFSSTPEIPEEIQKEWAEIAKKNNFPLPASLETMITVNTKETHSVYEENEEIRINSEENADKPEIVVVNIPSVTPQKVRRNSVYNQEIENKAYDESHMNYELRRMNE